MREAGEALQVGNLHGVALFPVRRRQPPDQGMHQQEHEQPGLLELEHESSQLRFTDSSLGVRRPGASVERGLHRLVVDRAGRPDGHNPAAPRLPVPLALQRDVNALAHHL